MNPGLASREIPETASPDTMFPSEPFACPNCGQMLAPSCRVCVACHTPVDFSKLQRAETSWEQVGTKEEPTSERPGGMQFSWRIFLAVLGIYLALVMVVERYLSVSQCQLFLGGILLGSSAWVFYDARLRRVPHAFRWGISSLLLWIVVFPWYVSRRRAPEVPCPLMEAEPSLFMRALLWIIVILFILGIAAAFIHKVPH